MFGFFYFATKAILNLIQFGVHLGEPTPKAKTPEAIGKLVVDVFFFMLCTAIAFWAVRLLWH